jgi:hypothetical protein
MQIACSSIDIFAKPTHIQSVSIKKETGEHTARQIEISSSLSTTKPIRFPTYPESKKSRIRKTYVQFERG